jgi:WD40 repeat protein
VFGAGEDAVVVSGDIHGVLRLSRWPCGKDTEQREFRCHSGGEVRCARFDCNFRGIFVSDGFGVLSYFAFSASDIHASANGHDTVVGGSFNVAADASLNSIVKDFVVCSSLSCATSSLKIAFFSKHTSVVKVVFENSQSLSRRFHIILSKFQTFTCLCLDPSDSFLAAACKDGTILIYDVNTEITLAELCGHGDGGCTAFRFSPNMIDAVSSSDKGQLLVSVPFSTNIHALY